MCSINVSCVSYFEPPARQNGDDDGDDDEEDDEDVEALFVEDVLETRDKTRNLADQFPFGCPLRQCHLECESKSGKQT